MTSPSQRPNKKPRVLVLWNQTDESVGVPAARAQPHSLTAIREALEEANYDVRIVNAEDDVDRVGDAVVVHLPAFVVNLVDHFYGDVGQRAAVAHLLELFGYQYTGSDGLCLASCEDRVRTRLLLQNGGVSVPGFGVVRDVNALPDIEKLRTPLIVTQAFDDVYYDRRARTELSDREEVAEHTRELLVELELPLLIEEFWPGRRIAATVIGHRVLEVLPLCEVRTVEGSEHETAEIAQLDVDLAGQIRLMARRAFRIAGCRDIARIDFAVSETGEIGCTDIRPTVDVFADDSAFTVSAEHSDRGYNGVIAAIAQLAFRRVPAVEAPNASAPDGEAAAATRADQPPEDEPALSPASDTPDGDDDDDDRTIELEESEASGAKQ